MPLSFYEHSTLNSHQLSVFAGFFSQSWPCASLSKYYRNILFLEKYILKFLWPRMIVMSDCRFSETPFSPLSADFAICRQKCNLIGCITLFLSQHSYINVTNTSTGHFHRALVKPIYEEESEIWRVHNQFLITIIQKGFPSHALEPIWIYEE